MKSLKKLADLERRKLQEKLSNTEPGTDEYKKLLAAREQLEDIEAKRRDGRIKPIDAAKLLLALASTVGLVLADYWIPSVVSKLKLGEVAKHLFK